MLQLYFLSVLCNGLSGYVLFAGSDNPTEDNKGFWLNNPTFHLVLGILCAVTGVLKLLSPTLEKILILGDLIPAAGGIVAGLLLIFGIYRKDSSVYVTESMGALDKAGVYLLRFRKSVGLCMLAITLIHFLFPQTLFL